MIKHRYGLGQALDRLSQTFNTVHVHGTDVTVYDAGPGEHGTKVGSVGYSAADPKVAVVNVVAPEELSRVKALVEYAEALEELANPRQRGH